MRHNTEGVGSGYVGCPWWMSEEQANMGAINTPLSATFTVKVMMKLLSVPISFTINSAR
jgi:hypothetical protein